MLCVQYSSECSELSTKAETWRILTVRMALLVTRYFSFVGVTIMYPTTWNGITTSAKGNDKCNTDLRYLI